MFLFKTLKGKVISSLSKWSHSRYSTCCSDRTMRQVHRVNTTFGVTYMLSCGDVCHLSLMHLSFMCALSCLFAASCHFQALFAVLFAFCHIASNLLLCLCTHSVFIVLTEKIGWIFHITMHTILFIYMYSFYITYIYKYMGYIYYL